MWGRRNNRRVLLCLHGYSGNGRDFDELARAVSGSYRVVCPDTAGRGRSAWLRHPLQYHFGQFMADLRSLLAELDADEVDIVGTSMGGLLGMMLAAQPASPVRSLVMNDVGAFLPPDALRAIARNLEAPATFASLAEVEAHMRHTHREWGQLTDAQWKHLAIHGSRREGDGYRLHFDPAIVTAARPIPLSPGFFFWDTWYRVRCPVLLLRGEESRVFPRHVADTMLEIKPQAQLVEIADVGHVPALMSADQIGIVGAFLACSAPRMEPRRASPVFHAARHESHQRTPPPRPA